MAFSIKIETYEPLGTFESWLDINTRNTWDIEFSELGELDGRKVMNKAKKTLVFRFVAKSDKEAFKRAYLKGLF